MHSSSDIQFLKNDKIDKNKWDECIKEAFNGLIYARTFYLDNIAAGWNALTGRNYEWVLPVTNKRKYGVSYLAQPSFTQQLGVFAKPGADVPYKEIFQYLQQHYKFCDIQLNYATPSALTTLALQIEPATNFMLDLSKSYENLAANYHNDLIKNLKRSKRFQPVYRPIADYNQCIGLYKQYYGQRMPYMKERDYKNFSGICSYAEQNDMIVCREAVNKDGVLLAATLLLSDEKRLYNLMNTTTEAGRRTGANHFLLDSVIREFAGKKMVFDFEGSDLPGVKSFYENFGAVNQPYFKYNYNRLPWPLRLFKK